MSEERERISPIEKKSTDNAKHNSNNNSVFEEQKDLLTDYFGIGEKRLTAIDFVRKINSYEDTKFLLLTETEETADELCSIVNSAIINFEDINDSVDSKNKGVNYGRSDRNFVRIGSESHCAQEHKHNLLSIIKNNYSSKNKLKSFFSRHQIFISTAESIKRKNDILDINMFDVIIVNRDSQITIKALGSLLKEYGRFIIADLTNKIS